MSASRCVYCLLLSLLILPTLAGAQQSRCYGTTSSGRLEGGVQLPVSGRNYEGYSRIARLAGRTYVHAEVRDIVVSAYEALETTQPGKLFKYAETGFEEGGEFKPHKTHRNGLSVDFMVPVVTAKGQSVQLPTHPFNRFGYNIEFDDQGRYQQYLIDFEALAAHIVALHQQAVARGYELWRVIFDPTLQPSLFDTAYGNYLRAHIQFSSKRSWVRHDEHYHVDFLVPCDEA